MRRARSTKPKFSDMPKFNLHSFISSCLARGVGENAHNVQRLSCDECWSIIARQGRTRGEDEPVTARFEMFAARFAAIAESCSCADQSPHERGGVTHSPHRLVVLRPGDLARPLAIKVRRCLSQYSFS